MPSLAKTFSKAARTCKNVRQSDFRPPPRSSTDISLNHKATPRSITRPIFEMASRRLALNLRQANRSRLALNAVRSPVTRGLAIPVSHGVKTESTTLSNGFTV